MVERRGLLTPVLLVCAATLMVWQSVALLRLFPSHDQSWYLIGAERLLHGTTLYGPDYSETNPPLIVWFSAIPVLLARWSSLSAMSCLRLTTLFLIGGSVWASVSLLRRQLGTARAALLAPLAVALVATFFLMNLYEFGQREQLMLAFTLPYLLALGRIDEQSRMEWVLLGLAAGFGVCLKPQQALTIVAVELYLAYATRSLKRLFSPGLLALIATGLVYLGLIRLLTPLYLSQTLPDLRNCYWAFGSFSTTYLLIHSRGRAMLLAVVALVVSTRLQRRLRLSASANILLVASLGASVALCIQHTGWNYQAFPAKAMLWLVLMLLAIEPVWAWSSQGSSRQAIAAAMCVLIALGVTVEAKRNIPKESSPDTAAVEQLLASARPGDTVMNFSMGGGAVLSAAINHHLQWGSPFFHFWRLPAIVQNERGPAGGGAPFKRLAPETLHRLEQDQQQDAARDLARWQPLWVMVERCTAQHRCPETGPTDFDTVGWMRHNGAFDREWGAYAKFAENPAFDLYRRVR